jgi:dTDP-glucose 4,6-dehydratase
LVGVLLDGQLPAAENSIVILVTGAAGLVGRELVGQLAATGVPVHGLDVRPMETSGPARHIVGDLLDPSVTSRACDGVRTIVHTAARQYHSGVPRWGRRRFFDVNAQMTRRLVEAAVASGVTNLIFISSDMVYGMPRGRPFTESDVPRPIGPYGASKLASEEICTAARAQGLRVTIFRPRLIVGPGRLGVLRKLFDRIRTGRFVPMLGDGSNRYQMVAVSDVVAACRLAIEHPVDAALNLGSANPPTIRSLLSSLCERAGSTSRPRALPASAACAGLWALHVVRAAPLSPEQFRIAVVDYVLDTSSAARLLNWQPRCSDMDMLSSAYESYVAGLSPRDISIPRKSAGVAHHSAS